jgi:peptidoglycan/xylan/chitin deacetylase (PgdA/CDA1 family)
VASPKFRCNVLLSFDLDADSIEARTCPNKPVILSKGQFGPKVGLPRILKLLDKYEIKTTFFVPGWCAEQYPEAVHSMLDHGHEVGAHGYLHENLGEVKSQEEELQIFGKMMAALEKTIGRKPVGYRAPSWEFSPRTLKNLVDFGFKYDSDLMDDEKPYMIKIDGKPTGMVELPATWLLDDWHIYEVHRRSPDDAFNNWYQEFDALYAENVPYYNLTMHPQTTGRASRTKVLERLIRAMKRRPGVVFTRCVDLAEHVAAQHQNDS